MSMHMLAHHTTWKSLLHMTAAASGTGTHTKGLLGEGRWDPPWTRRGAATHLEQEHILQLGSRGNIQVHLNNLDAMKKVRQLAAEKSEHAVGVRPSTCYAAETAGVSVPRFASHEAFSCNLKPSFL